MALMLTISKLPEGAALADQDKTFNEKGGKIGRAPGNDWILPDENRYLSSFHAEIAYENNQYFLIDTSTNGVFVNSSDKALGKGNTHLLKDGDTIALGDYLIVSSVTNFVPQVPKVGSEEQTLMNADSPPETPDFDAWLEPDAKPAAAMPKDEFSEDPFFNPMADAGGDVFSDTPDPTPSMLDPLKALDKSDEILGGEQEFDLPKDGSMNDQITPDQMAFVPPSISPQDQDKPSAYAEASMGDQLSNTGMNAKIAALDAFLDDPSDIAPAQPQSPPQQPTPSQPAQQVPPAAPETPSFSSAKETSDLDAFLGDSLLGGMSSEATPPPAQVKPTPGQAPATPKPAPRPTPQQQAPQQAPQARPQQTPSQPQAARPVLSAGEVKDLGASLGVDTSRLTQEQLAELPAEVGEILKVSIQGLMKVLSARSSLKNEFRISMTTIQPQENNPLKFSASYEDALDKMFLAKTGAYMGPKEAVEDAFQDLGFHQMAMLAGMREAFNLMMNRFSPDVLQQKFDEFGKKGSLIGGKRAAYWEAYEAEFEKLKSDPEQAFKQLFGNDFAEAYEHFLAQLKNR